MAAYRQLAESGAMAALEQCAKELTAPFYWYGETPPTDEGEPSGGTICFVYTGQTLLGVSAAHVHRACVEFVESSPGASCQIGGHSFNPADRMIDIDDRIDLVTYNLSAIQVTAAGAYAYSPMSWPPNSSDTDHVYVGGWLWSMTADYTHESTHSFVSFVGKLTAQSSRNLVMGVFKSTSVPWGSGFLPPNANLGGMSGGPLYAIRTEPLMRLELIGITYKYDQNSETVYARPVSLIRSDGRLFW